MSKIVPIRRRVDARPAPAQPQAPATDAGPSIALGVVVGQQPGATEEREEATGGLWQVRLGGRTGASASADLRPCAADASVDPALLREAIATGARVVLDRDESGEMTIVGVLATRRALTIDRTGAVEADVRRFSITAAEEALLRASGAFLQIKLDDVELYGKRVVSRARELYRVLGRMVKIN